MINIIKKRRLWYLISLVVFCIGVIGMVNNYRSFNHIFNLGIDFTGGTSIILRFSDPVSGGEASLRNILNATGLEKHTIQTSGGSDIMIKTEEMTVQKRNELFNSIRQRVGAFDVLEVDIIGPSIGEELKQTSIVIILVVAIAILIYCSWRFELTFGMASIIALIHDALMILVMSAFFQIEMNTAFIAALLTVLGYSINDTIVIFDRIREKFREIDDDTVSKSKLNVAVNEMLPRSIHTSITTGIVTGALFLFAGVSLKVFSTVLIMGLITGTYSSLFIASPMVLTISRLRGVTIVK
jgi:preprotein translocase subunit SecF